MPTTAANLKHKLVVGQLLADPGISFYKAMINAGYAPTTAREPTKNLFNLESFQELLARELPDSDLLSVHKKLLKTRQIDHMVYPLSITDEDIDELVSSVGGTLRKIVHGETAKHAYWWVPNDDARLKALKLAYELKGKLGNKDQPPPPNQYNTFIQNNRIDPNTPDAQELSRRVTAILLEQTKRRPASEGQTVQS